MDIIAYTLARRYTDSALGNLGLADVSATAAIGDPAADPAVVVTKTKEDGVTNFDFEFVGLGGSPRMERDFTTQITVGFLEEGTPIYKQDLIRDILYRILTGERPEPLDAITMYFGACDNIPTSEKDLSWKEYIEVVDVDGLLSDDCTHGIKCGNVDTLKGQYPVIVIKKNSKRNVQLTKWTVQGAEIFAFPYETIETEDSYIYYMATKNYDEDEGGKTYIFKFAEV